MTIGQSLVLNISRSAFVASGTVQELERLEGGGQ
jgi:malonyl CoA-acyl carrier protein transacylase